MAARQEETITFELYDKIPVSDGTGHRQKSAVDAAARIVDYLAKEFQAAGYDRETALVLIAGVAREIYIRESRGRK